MFLYPPKDIPSDWTGLGWAPVSITKVRTTYEGQMAHLRSKYGSEGPSLLPEARKGGCFRNGRAVPKFKQRQVSEHNFFAIFTVAPS